MAQLFPVLTAGEPFDTDASLNDREAYLTQPVLMADLSSPGQRFVTRVTLDFEQLTQPGGELTFGGWGEGFIDKRHPHTLLHELMLSVNSWMQGGAGLSISAGKGFAPYGTEDPMGRPVLKYPTNHHLSQILERWTVNGTLTHPSGWSLEAGVFGGDEPDDAYDLSNIESFGDSWSARLSRRIGAGPGYGAWEAAASYARVAERHHGESQTTQLANAYVRHEGARGLYTLVEASRSFPEEGDGYWAVLAESRLASGPHQPYARVEWATRPEYPRLGAPGSEDFFRYDHGAHPLGSTEWLILSAGYGLEVSGGPVSTHPFIELQYHRVGSHTGGIDPRELYGGRGLWSVSTGLRLFWGGGPMRMGSYGALDPMTTGRRAGHASHH